MTRGVPADLYPCHALSDFSANKEGEILSIKGERVEFTWEQHRVFLGARQRMPRRSYCIMALVQHRLTFMPR